MYIPKTLRIPLALTAASMFFHNIGLCVTTPKYGLGVSPVLTSSVLLSNDLKTDNTFQHWVSDPSTNAPSSNSTQLWAGTAGSYRTENVFSFNTTAYPTNQLWNKFLVVYNSYKDNLVVGTVVDVNGTSKNAAYVIDPSQGRIKIEGMTYGMMIAVQTGNRNLFNKFLTYTQVKMFIAPYGYTQGYHCEGRTPTQTAPGQVAVADGEIWYAAAVTLADLRWNTAKSTTHPYRREAIRAWQRILSPVNSGNLKATVVNVDAADTAGFEHIRCNPNGTYTNPSYLTPAFFSLAARYMNSVLPGACYDKDNTITYQTVLFNVTSKARRTIQYTPSSSGGTNWGLHPVYTKWDGTIHNNSRYAADAHRVPLNMAIDTAWTGVNQASYDYAVTTYHRTQAYLDTTKPGPGQECNLTPSNYGTLVYGGTPVSATGPNATCAFLYNSTDLDFPVNNAVRNYAVATLWNQAPSGQYYNELVHTLSMLVATGRFRNAW